MKKHLISSLENKIKLLKLLSSSRVSNRDKVLYYDKLSKGKPISKNLLNYIGITNQEYLQINPGGSVQSSSTDLPESQASKKRKALGTQREDGRKKSESPTSRISSKTIF